MHTRKTRRVPNVHGDLPYFVQSMQTLQDLKKIGIVARLDLKSSSVFLVSYSFITDCGFTIF